MSFFDMLKRDDQYKGLEGLMKVWLNGRPHWSDEAAGFYPVRERLIKGADKDSNAAFLVDIGGGHGQDFSRLLANVPQGEIPGRLVLQDQPHVIGEIPEGSLPASVEKMSYDFFTSQPVEGKSRLRFVVAGLLTRRKVLRHISCITYCTTIPMTNAN